MREYQKLALITGYFVLLGLSLYFLQLGQLSWTILLVSAIGWFVLQSNRKRERFPTAMKIGAFLLVFDFIIENSGWLFGLWQTKSALAVGVVPIEVMGIAFFGGTAWASYMPKKFNLWQSLCNCIVFAFFGALGEWLLIRQGLFVYNLWWSSELAFVAYFITWVVLVFVRYRVFRD